jgi:hypothetical protein
MGASFDPPAEPSLTSAPDSRDVVSEQSNDDQRRRQPHERKRQFLRLEKLVDPRQSLVNVDLGGILFMLGSLE